MTFGPDHWSALASVDARLEERRKLSDLYRKYEVIFLALPLPLSRSASFGLCVSLNLSVSPSSLPHVITRSYRLQKSCANCDSALMGLLFNHYRISSSRRFPADCDGAKFD